VALLVALAEGTKPFYFDSGGYWNLSESFTRSGHFSFFDFEDPLRGYALPLLFWGPRNAAEVLTSNQSLMVRGFNAATFALIGAVLAPRLAMIAWPQVSWNVTRRLALTALILVFWSGYLSFPMSDFPSLAVALLALVAIFRADSPPWLLVAGIAAGLALNMRAGLHPPAAAAGRPARVGLDRTAGRPASFGRAPSALRRGPARRLRDHLSAAVHLPAQALRGLRSDPGKHRPEAAGSGLFLDVGASIGQSALSFRIFNREAPVLSLEPLPSHRSDLRFVRRVIRGHRFMIAGAAEKSCRATLYVPMLGSYEPRLSPR
jgi:hypothetical protein